jgi:hypothetical protein
VSKAATIPRLSGGACITALVGATCVSCSGSPTGAPVTTYKQVYTAYYGTPPAPVARFNFVQVFSFGAFPESNLKVTVTNVWSGAAETLCFDFVTSITDGSRSTSILGGVGGVGPEQNITLSEGSVPIAINSANIGVTVSPWAGSATIFCP